MPTPSFSATQTQVWILTIQFFECLNVAAQTLCAAYLGECRRIGTLPAWNPAGHDLLLALGMGAGVADACAGPWQTATPSAVRLRHARACIWLTTSCAPTRMPTGAGDRQSANMVLTRLLTLGVLIGAAVGGAVFVGREPIAAFFSKDNLVIEQVGLPGPHEVPWG